MRAASDSKPPLSRSTSTTTTPERRHPYVRPRPPRPPRPDNVRVDGGVLEALRYEVTHRVLRGTRAVQASQAGAAAILGRMPYWKYRPSATGILERGLKHLAPSSVYCGD